MNEVLRQEKKYLIHTVKKESLNQRLKSVMLEDKHNGISGYRVRSLYFDTLDDTDYFDKVNGIERRRKIRLRLYDPNGDFAMLEMKQKQGDYQRKRSLKLKREDARQLIKGNYEVLLQYPEAFSAECYTCMKTMCYLPKSVVEYRRTAYVAKENRIRVTFDSDIIASETCFDIFSSNLLLNHVLDPFHTVLEVKYNGFLLSYIKSLVNEVDCSTISVSKYALSRSSGLHAGF